MTITKPVIAYTLHCRCGFTTTQSLSDHASNTLDGFHHRVAGWTVRCISCGRALAGTPSPKSHAENWARQHRALGCAS